MRRILVGILLALVMVASFAVPVFAAEYDEVTVTATPTYLAMTLTPPSPTWALDAVHVSTTYWWTADGLIPDPAENFEAADMKNEIENTGSVAEVFTITGADFTGGLDPWILSADVTPAEGEVSISAGTTGCASVAAMVVVDTGGNILVAKLNAGSKIKWCMNLITPSSFTHGDPQEGVVTVTATEWFE